MPKRRDLLKRIARAAQAQGLIFQEDTSRKRGNHDIFILSGKTIPVPRHREINEVTAESIYKQAEEVLGKRWWK